MPDISLIETYDGGDFQIMGGDLSMTDGYEGMVYLALFGGGEWWGNELMQDQDSSTLFASQTEKLLQSVALTSAGRLKIEQAIMSDLQFFKSNFSDTVISVETEIVNQYRLDINIKINAQVIYMQVKYAALTAGKSMTVYLGVFSKEFTEQFT